MKDCRVKDRCLNKKNGGRGSAMNLTVQRLQILTIQTSVSVFSALGMHAYIYIYIYIYMYICIYMSEPLHQKPISIAAQQGEIQGLYDTACVRYIIIASAAQGFFRV